MAEPLVGSLIDAGTAIAVRDADSGIEVLLVHKGAGPQFHAGSWVFPGGKVDPDDRDAANGDRLGACAVAAVRETAEESGVALDPESLLPFAHWTTPEGAPRRFATWFFLALPAAGGDHAPKFDGSEIQNAAWMTPQQALDQHHGGELDLPIPQYVSLLALADAADVEAAYAAARAVEPIEYLGKLREDEAGRLVFVYLPDAAFDGGALDLPGARHRLVMDGRRMLYERS